MLKTVGLVAAGTALVAGAAGAVGNSASAAQQTTPPSSTSVAVTERSNSVAIFADPPLPTNSISFTWDGGYSITSGQPWDGVTSSENDDQLLITAEAGRSGSSGPAQWFNSMTSLPIGNDENLDAKPAELNFAFSGTLTIEGHQYPVVIGQGHNMTDDNWWIGGQGSGWTTYKVAPPTITTPDGLYQITTSGDDADDAFNVSPAN